MATYSVRCRNSACRHRRVTTKHPDDYILVPRCTECGSRKGWRIENRAYNRRDMCTCGQSPTYPHRVGKYRFCDFHPQGFYNQAKRQGVHDDDIPLEYLGRPCGKDEPCPF